MNRRRIFLTSACFFCAATGFEAGAQTCHTVRDKDGLIVYQSIRPPVDTSVPYKYEIEAMFPGGYMEIERNFHLCGNYERPTPKVFMAPASKTKPLEQRPASETPSLIPKPADPTETPGGIFAGLTNEGQAAPVPAQSPQQEVVAPVAAAEPTASSHRGGGLGKILAAVIVVAALCAPKPVRNVILALVASLFVAAFGFIAYEAARPPPLPYAQCLIDVVPAVRNDVAAYAAASQCVQLHGGYNNAEAKRYLKGQAIGFLTPKSRAECVTKYASNTSSDMAAKLIYGACNCLYQSPSEGAGDASYSCG